MLCSTLLPYQNALTDPLLRCPITLYPSAFDHPSPLSPATQQASRAHDKRDLYNTCIVSQLSRNKYCLNQNSLGREFRTCFIEKELGDTRYKIQDDFIVSLCIQLYTYKTCMIFGH